MSELSWEVLDVLRQADMVGVSLEDFMDRNAQDLYEIRLTMTYFQDYVWPYDVEYYGILLDQSGPVIRALRTAIQNDLDITPLLPWMGKGLADNTFCTVVAWYQDGLGVPPIDLRLLPEDCSALDSLVRSGLDVWNLVAKGEKFDPSLVRLSASLGDPQYAVKGWSLQSLRLIHRVPQLRQLPLTHYTTYETVSSLADVFRSSLPIDVKKTLTDFAEDWPVYTNFQRHWALTAHSEGLPLEPFLDPTLGVSDLAVIAAELKAGQQS